MNSIGFIGAGNMATAIISGIKNGSIECDIYAFDLNKIKLDNLNKYGVIATSSSVELVKKVDYLLLAVKPQHITQVLEEIKPHINHNTVIISIAAGITGAYISKVLSFSAKVVQVMPNTPLMLSLGATAMSKWNDVSDKEFEFAKSLFDCAGKTEIIPKEKMNEIIPINGSSPAFIYKFAECFVNYGKSVGIDEKVCLNLFAQSLVGSAKMLTDSGMSIEELITMVSSKGGTTIAGLDGLNEMKLNDAVLVACEKCVSRAYELTLE